MFEKNTRLDICQSANNDYLDLPPVYYDVEELQTVKRAHSLGRSNLIIYGNFVEWSGNHKNLYTSLKSIPFDQYLKQHSVRVSKK